MDTRFFLTADGSHTLFNETLNAYYHSIHGALEESQHIFINLGLREVLNRYLATDSSENPDTKQGVTVFEMGFGTGLNAFLTWREAEKKQVPIQYVTVEAYPITEEKGEGLNYNELFQTNQLTTLHRAPWGEPIPLSPYFTIEKQLSALQDFDPKFRFDAIYYDAFAPAAQPELWTPEIFEKLARWLKTGGNLTTYCTKGYVKRNLKSAGFTVQKHPGPGYKREVLRAIWNG
jgi:tRNA U34 5-methylaminomethyl-2-thiouridine-forming methyltransferase MnmC